MIKEQVKDLKKVGVLYDGEGSIIYKLDDGRLYKEAKPFLLSLCAVNGIDYERKILSTNAETVESIVSPITVAYSGRQCTGFTMENEIGETLNSYDENYTLEQRSNLGEYANLFTKIEDGVKSANKVGIVMPDLCTCDNIILSPDGTLKFIDFDGMQFGKNDKSIAYSTSLGHIYEYLYSKKFIDGPCHFTQELDKTSLTILMFLVVFNIDLNKVGMINPFSGKKVTLEEVFEQLGLDDAELFRKVKANLSLRDSGAYIAEDLRRIAQKYEMRTMEVPKYICPDGGYLKKLIRK